MIEILLLSIFPLLGVWFTSMGIFMLIAGIASPNWPKAKGKIISVELATGRTGLGAEAFWPKIKYEYLINSHKFIGKRIAFGKYGTKWNNTLNKSVAEGLISTYKKGGEVEISYSPHFKFISVLISGFSWGAVGILSLGFLWLSSLLLIL